jgi:hypothetical protein
MIIDMALVFSGFARNFPGKAKSRGFDLHWNDGDYHNDLVTERIMNGTDIVVATRSELSQKYIFDHYIIYNTGFGEIIGIHCTTPQDALRARWEPCIAMVGRYIDTHKIGINQGPWSVPAQLYLAQKETPCTYAYQNWFQWQHKIDWVGEDDFGGHIGRRWYMAIGTDMPYLGVVKEQWVWDLGPQIGVFNPVYGLIGYNHIHPNYAIIMERYNFIVDFDLTVNECNHIIL